ncbi:amidohydrolase [Candidatus Koribacter versatilis Ellin345]|uniref:Amidohydrolase n=1 Tax=Koribacter versatilis (strain Ellin345) TaxID=204669 RepID=Q1II00_KORVE|nr:amidohydrolase family protein [Candidatus Koribacter versatilis]ABF43500.1 amidohydrolase [Candidatus Koribacter versatilis Ellin345]
MKKLICTTLLLSAFTLAQSAPAPKTVVVKGAKLLTVSHGTIENGTIVLSGGKITAVGAAAEVKVPAGAEVMDGKGLTVYPGLIDSETHLGLTEVQADEMTNDLVEASDEIMPHMHVYDGFHAESTLIPVTRYNGITNAIVAPDDKDTLPGQDSFIQLYGANSNAMILGRDVAMPLNFTGAQRRNESFSKAKFPQTRMGMAAQLRQTFIDAQEYVRKGDENNAKAADKREHIKRDLKLEALVPYLKGEKPVVLEANTASEFDAAIALAQEFKLKIVLNHLSHAQQVLDQIAALKVPVIVGPIYDMPKEDERYDSVYKLPAELQKRGVKVLFASYDAHQSRNLPYAAGYAVAFGLPYDEALKAITLYPAEVWGVADKLGSLDVGKQANVVIANGDPLDVKTEVKRVFIGGIDVPMVTKQTILRDQYGGGTK